MKHGDEGVLVYEHDENLGGHGWANACILRVVGLPLALVGGLLIYAALASEGQPEGLMFGSVLLLMSVIMLTGATNQHRLDMYTALTFDPNAEQLRIHKRVAERALCIPFSELARIVVCREVVLTTEGKLSHREYRGYVVLADDARIWITSHRSGDALFEELTPLIELLAIEVVDEADGDRGRAAERTWPARQRGPASTAGPPSRYVQCLEDFGRTIYQLDYREPLSVKILWSAICTFFMAIPLSILGMTWSAALSDGSIYSYGALVVVTPLLVGFMLLAVLMLATMMRHYRVSLCPGEVLVEVYFRVGLLQRYLGKSCRIPNEAVRSIRVQRNAQGALMLDVVHEGSATVHDPFEMHREGAFAVDEDSDGPIRPLWTFHPGTAEGTGPDFADAAYLLATLRGALCREAHDS